MELKIEKLSDIVAWADGKIRDGGYYEEKYRSDATTAYCDVKAHELWRIRDVALKAMERHSVYTNALNKDIADKAAKIDLLEKEIEGRKEGYYTLKEQLDHTTALKDGWYANAQELVETCKSKNEEIEKLKKKIVDLENEIESRKNAFNELREEMANRYIAIETHNDICKTYEIKAEELEKELADCKVKIRHQKENLDGINKTLEIRTKENERLIAVKNNQQKEIEAHEAENARLSEKILSLKDELEDATQYKELVDELGKKNDKIKALVQEADYYKNQERIRTDQLRATESKVDELWRLVNDLKKEKKEGYDYVESGFKLYVKNTLTEAEGDKNEANEVITEAVRSAYAEWGKEQKEKEETVKYKPSEIDSFTYFLKDEVNKKRIVDIRHSVENYLHVTRDLLDTAVKLIVAKGYHEYEGVVTGYGKFHVLTTPDVEFKDLYDTWKIKSIGPDIPCGEDAIE